MEQLSTVAVYLVSALLTATSAILSIAIEKKFGILCKDAHKPYGRYVPCIGGFSPYLGFSAGLFMIRFLNVVDNKLFITTMLSITIATAIGFLDDVINLRSRWKILLGFLPALPILALDCYTPRPWLPFIGHARIHIVYPLLILLSSTIYTNGANMIDTHNGTLPMFILSVSISALLLKLLTYTEIQDLYIASLIVAVVATYLVFNIYPAKLFNGNTGSYFLGSLMLVITVVLRVEFFTVLASVPMFLNGFYYVSSVKGFIQKEKVDRPTYVDKNGCIHPKLAVHPITLVKILLIFAKNPLNEKELVVTLYSVYLFTSFLSFIICMILGYS